MIILGLILLLLDWLVFHTGVLFWIGLVLAVVGLVLLLLGHTGRPVGSRRHYW